MCLSEYGASAILRERELCLCSQLVALGMYGDKWVFWAITKYDILVREKKKSE
jgi:hypothetical protein